MSNAAFEDQGYSFGIFELAGGALIGRITLSRITRRAFQNCGLGYWVDQAHAGRGIATEAVRSVVSYAFHDLLFHRVEAATLLHNAGSIRVLEKAGFRREGLALRYLEIDVHWQDHALFAVTVEEWPARQPPSEDQLRLTLPFPPHYRFDAMIEAHGWPQLAPFAWDAEAKTLRRVEQLASGKVVRLDISSPGATLDVDILGPELDPAELAEVERVVRWIVELDEDFEEFYAFCADYPALQHIPGRGLGPMLRGTTVWEDYVKTVCTTNTTWAQTRAMVARLVEAYGAPFEIDGPRAFPSPEVVAATTPEAFAAAVRAGYRAPYLHATAREIAEGKLDLERFKQRAREVDTATLMTELRKLRGIGPYAAAHMAMLLGSYGYVPVDSWARELVRGYFNGGAPVTDREAHAHFEQFGRWRALAFRCWDWEGTTHRPAPSASDGTV